MAAACGTGFVSAQRNLGTPGLSSYILCRLLTGSPREGRSPWNQREPGETLHTSLLSEDVFSSGKGLGVLGISCHPSLGSDGALCLSSTTPPNPGVVTAFSGPPKALTMTSRGPA